MEVFLFDRRIFKSNERLERVAKLYLATRFLGALYFAWPIFYGFASQSLSPAQIGVFFSILGIIQFVAEVPTGVVADRYSRKLSGIVGTAIALVAPLIIFYGHNFQWYLVAALFYGVGRAFLSGSLDSLVYDHKNVSKEAFRHLGNLEVALTQAAGIASAAAGGLLYSLHPSLPFLAEALAGVICLVVILQMQEDRRNDYNEPSGSYTAHFAEGIRYLLATRYLRIVVLMGVTFSVVLRLCIQFVNEAAMIEHGLRPSARGLLIAIASVITMVIFNLVVLRVLKQDRAKVLFMGFGAVVVFALLSVNVGWVFLGAFLFWNLLLTTQSPFTKPLIHDGLPGSHRSTAMSGYSALVSLIGFGGSALIGALIQRAHTSRAAYIFYAIISLVVLVPCALWLANHLECNTEKQKA